MGYAAPQPTVLIAQSLGSPLVNFVQEALKHPINTLKTLIRRRPTPVGLVRLTVIGPFAVQITRPLIEVPTISLYVHAEDFSDARNFS